MYQIGFEGFIRSCSDRWQKCRTSNHEERRTFKGTCTLHFRSSYILLFFCFFFLICFHLLPFCPLSHLLWKMTQNGKCQRINIQSVFLFIHPPVEAITGFIQAKLSQIQGLFKDQPHSFQGLWYLPKSVNFALLSIGSKSSNKFWVKTLIISAK